MSASTARPTQRHIAYRGGITKVPSVASINAPTFGKKSTITRLGNRIDSATAAAATASRIAR
jgi:hypothetical protein